MRNEHIQNKGLKTFFFASVLASVIMQIDFMIDGIIVSHFVSPDALSVISLSIPVMSVLYLFAGVIGMGFSVLVPKEIGMQNYIGVARLFTSGMLLALSVTGIVAAGLIVFSEEIAMQLTTDIRLLPLLQSYLPVMFIGSLAVVAFTLAIDFVKQIGHPELATKAVIIAAIVNICLDLLLVGVFSCGIIGAAWGTTISVLLACIFLAPSLQGKMSTITWGRPHSSYFFSCGKNLIINGVPAAVNSASMAILFALLNMLVLRSWGPDGIFILSVILQMLMLMLLVLNGAAEAVTGIGGVMLGEGDIDRYRCLVFGILKKSSLALAVLTIILIVYPDMLAILFGASNELLDIVRLPLRVFCLSFIPIGIIIILVPSFLLLGYRVLSSVIPTLYVVCLIPLVWVASVFYPQYLWYALTAGFWLILIIVLCCSLVISRKNRNLHWLTLISKLPNNPSISLSVNYDKESVYNALDQIHTFLGICELDHSLYYKVASCLEELTYNLISMTENTGKIGWFDLRVVDDGNKITITMKDDGEPYNPILKYNPSENYNADDANYALIILNAFCTDLNYKYMNGINCVYMNFKYAK